MTDPLKDDPALARMIAAVIELRREYPPARSAAERAANDELVDKYPGLFVAFTDDWDGEKLTRQVLATGRSSTEAYARLNAVADYEAIRHKLTVRDVEDPNDPEDAFMRGSLWLEDAEPLAEEGGDGAPRLPG